jgi:hypothetical protein
MAPGTLALVKVKVSGGASAAVAATTVNAAANARVKSIDLQFFIGFILMWCND